MAQLSFGIKTIQEHTTYAQIRAVWKAADAIAAYEHAWLYDHFIPIAGDPDGPCLEGWTLLGALAAETSRIRLGLMVTGNTYRHPAVLANIGATVDIISGGRLEMGLGAGWNELEHSSYGIELLPPGRRLDQFAEACEIIRQLWTEQYTDFNGTYYQMRQARCEPKPVQQPYPPFVIGGSGERKTLRIVAQYAAVWNFAGGTPEEFSHKRAVLEEHCRAIGRDPATISKSIQPRINPDDLPATVEQIKRFVAAGADHIILNLRLPAPEGIVERMADEVIARVTG